MEPADAPTVDEYNPRLSPRHKLKSENLDDTFDEMYKQQEQRMQDQDVLRETMNTQEVVSDEEEDVQRLSCMAY